MKQGDKCQNFELKLVNGLEFDLYQTLKRGPVVLNFIMGTWCPFCTNHLKKIREWQSILGKNVTMLIVSSESQYKLRDWIDNNPTNYLFASDPNSEVIEAFGVKKYLTKMATPETFLIDSEAVIRLVFKQVRTKDSREKLLNNICTDGSCSAAS